MIALPWPKSPDPSFTQRGDEPERDQGTGQVQQPREQIGPSL